MDTITLAAGSTLILGIASFALYPAFKVIPFAYGSARVRAARSRMFKDSELQALTTESYKDVLYQLEKKGFRELLEHIDEDFDPDLVQQTLRKSYFRHLQRIIGYVPKRYEKFFTLLHRRAEFDFILAVLRSKTNPHYKQHIVKGLFVETKHFSKNDLEAIHDMPLDDFIGLLKRTPYFDLVSQFQEQIKAGNLHPFEETMQLMFFKKLKAAAGSEDTLRNYTRMLIDIYNIRHAACFGEKSSISGGRLDEVIQKKLEQSQTLEEVQRSLDGTYLAKYVEEVTDVITLERSLSRAKKTFAQNLAQRDPLSIGQILSFYIHKKIELQNIQILLQLIKAKFEPKKIQEVLI